MTASRGAIVDDAAGTQVPSFERGDELAAARCRTWHHRARAGQTFAALVSPPDEPTTPALGADTVLAVLRSTFRSWERDPSPLLGMDEENLRSVLVGSLNGSFEGRATAETYNSRGKTDILIRDRDRNVFIGECKIYNGPAGLVDAIDQLIDYTTARDVDLGLIGFVRSGALSTAIAALRTAAETSPHVTAIEQADDIGAELRLTARLPDDPERTVSVTAFLVHIPIPKRRRPRKPKEVMRPEDAMEAVLDIKRRLATDGGIDYTPTLDPDAARDEAVSGWRVTVSRVTPAGSAGIEAAPLTPKALAQHGPEGALIAPDAETARGLHESLRRTQRDLVPTDLTGLGIRIDRIPAALRDEADRLQRADPAHISGTYGPRGLWQCMVQLDTDRGSLEVPVAFAAVDPPDGWDVTARGTVFDFALSMSLRKDDRDVQFAWALSWNDSPARERLAALEFLYVYSGRGRLRIRSIEPEVGKGDFHFQGFDLDPETLFERELLLNVVAIENHVGIPVDILRPLEQEWVDTAFAAGRALRSRTAPVVIDNVVLRVDTTHGLPKPGEVVPVPVAMPVTYDLNDITIDLGTGHAELNARVVSVTHESGSALVEVEPTSSQDRHLTVSFPGDTAGHAEAA